MMPNAARKERERSARADAFLAAAERLFASHGYHETSIELIAREAEFATGTLYRYFRSKEELYVELLKRKLTEFLQELEDVHQAEPSPLPRLCKSVACKVAFFKKHRDFLSLYVKEFQQGAGGSCGLPDSCGEIQARMVFLLEKTLADGIEAGQFRKFDVRLMAAAISGAANRVLARWMEQGADENEDLLGAFLLPFLSAGLGCAGESADSTGSSQ